MGFDASTEIEPLDYDFTYFYREDAAKYAVLANAKGTVPEPSDEAVQRLQRNLIEATRVFTPGTTPRPGAGLTPAGLADLPRDVFEQAEVAILDAVSEICAGSPTREQLAALPYRHKRRFIGWLQRQLMNPES